MMGSQAGAPRIGLVGSCQVLGMGAALQKMWPDAEISAWHLGPKCPDSRDTIAQHLATCDLAISQVNEAEADAPLAFANLLETTRRAVFVPTFVFNGFHPDCIHIKWSTGLLVGPFVNLHSAIIAGGYVLGLPEAKVSRLFNALTYANLGYFDAYKLARRFVMMSYAEHGFDLTNLFDDFAKSHDAFMHTMNHPGIDILGTLAHMTAVKAGLAAPESPPPDGVEDQLALGLSWPVYPELARRLGVSKGDLNVLLGSKTRQRAPAHVRKLTDAVGAFYKFYAQQDQDALRAAVPARVVAGMEATLAG